MQRGQQPDRMKRWLAKRDRQGWSWSELSRRTGLPVWKLRWWSRRLAEGQVVGRTKRAFLPVHVVESGSGDGVLLEIVTPSGLRILVGPLFNTDHLRRVLKAVEPGY